MNLELIGVSSWVLNILAAQTHHADNLVQVVGLVPCGLPRHGVSMMARRTVSGQTGGETIKVLNTL